MTKTEILLGYRNLLVPSGRLDDSRYKLLDTWVIQGRQEIKADLSTRFYTPGTVYLLKAKGSYQYSLVMCCEEFIGSCPNWENMSLSDYELGYVTFLDNIVSPNFRFLITGEQLIEDGYLPTGIGIVKAFDTYSIHDEAFVPFKEEFQKTGIVQISDDDYGTILQVLGYPFIREEELEYTREQILNLAIKKGLQEYFHWIPKTRCDEIPVDLKKVKNILMPSDAYCVVGLSLQQNGVSLTGDVTNPLYFAYEQQLYGGMSVSGLTGHYLSGQAPHTNLNGNTTFLTNRAIQQSLINYSRRVHYEGPYTIKSTKEAKDIGLDNAEVGSKYIKVSSNTAGTYNIWWGINSLDFNDVEFAEKTRVIEYCQACVKELFGFIRGQVKSDIPGSVDYSSWVKEAKEQKDEITKAWREITKSSGILRGSLA